MRKEHRQMLNGNKRLTIKLRKTIKRNHECIPDSEKNNWRKMHAKPMVRRIPQKKKD